jgi:hypothetical protein
MGWAGRRGASGVGGCGADVRDRERARRLSRAEAARLAGMERQALRDAVLRYNAEGLVGLRDRPKGRPRRRLTASEEAELAAAILRGPDPEGVVQSAARRSGEP